MGRVSYSFPVSNGAYTVVLGFAEVPGVQPGQRIFDVLINGTKYISAFDVADYAKDFPSSEPIALFYLNVVVNTGQINIDFIPEAGNAMVSYVEIDSVATYPTSIAINCGGPAEPQLVQPDQGLSGTSGIYTVNMFSAAKAIYNTNRWGNFSYHFQMVPGNFYQVRLRFAETAPVAPGQRQFDVILAGIKVLPNFDVAATAGLNVPCDFTYALYLPEGFIDIDFRAVTGNAFVSGIDISLITQQGVAPTNINAGGPAYEKPGGPVFAADTDYIGGATYYYHYGMTTDPEIYETNRWGNFMYRIPIPPGLYDTTLSFAEDSFTAGPGGRQFNVDLNGIGLLSFYDVLVDAGGAFRAIDQTYRVCVENGVMDLMFTPVTANAMVSAIQIVPVTGSPNGSLQSVNAGAAGPLAEEERQFGPPQPARSGWDLGL